MRTISNSEFAAHPEMYLDMALYDDVRIRKEDKIFHLVYEPPTEPQIALAPDEELRNAITGEELQKRIYSDLETFFASKR